MLAKIKAAAAAFVAAALVTAYVPAVADVLVLALVASWAVIGAVLLALGGLAWFRGLRVYESAGT